MHKRIIIFLVILVALLVVCTSFWMLSRDQRTTFNSPTFTTHTSSVSYPGEYVQQLDSKFSNNIIVSQKGDLLAFEGLAVYPEYDSAGHVTNVNSGNFSGTTTVSNNKARYISRVFQSDETDQPCIVDFTFNSDNTLDINTSNGSFINCGWGFNVNFEGHYTKNESGRMSQNNQQGTLQNSATSTYLNSRLGFSMSLPKIIKSRIGKYLSVEARDDGKSNFITVGPTSYGDYVKIYVANIKNRAELENFIYSYMPEDKDCKIVSLDENKVGIQNITLEYQGKDEGGGIYCGDDTPVYIKYDAQLGKAAEWRHPGQDDIFLNLDGQAYNYDTDMYDSFRFISK